MDQTVTSRPQIALKPCSSSYLTAYGYCPVTKTLRVTFNGGKTGDYANVEPEAFSALNQAESKGKHFYQHIRDTHEFTPLEDEAAADEPDSKGG